MKNSFLTYRFWLVVLTFMVSLSAYAQKSNKRYHEADIMAEADFIAADALFLLGKYDDALAKFTEFIKLHPNVAAAHFQLARTYEALKESNKSLVEVEKAVQLDGQNRWFLIKQATMYESNGQADKSAEVMVNLAKIEPNSDFAYKKAAFYYLLAQMPNKAIDILNKGEKRAGYDPEFNHRKHVIYLAQGNTKKAIRELQNIIRHNPKATKFRAQLADIYLSTHQDGLAEKEYRSILEYDSFNPVALVGLQKRKISSEGTNSPALLKMVADPTISIDLKITEIVPIISQATRNASDIQKKEWSSIVEKLVQAHPTNAKGFSVSGDLYYAIGEYDKALDSYQKTLEKEKSVFPVWQQTIELLFAKKDYAGVINTSDKALNYFPNKSKIVLYTAEAKFRVGQAKEAVEAYKQAAFMSGRNHHQKRFIFGRLAEIYLAGSGLDKARKYLDKALQLDDAKDPYIQHIEKELDKKEPIPYDPSWLKLYPFGILLI